MRARQCVEQSAFARVGIAHERDGQHIRTAARATLHFALAREPREFVFQQLYAFAEQPAVGFELRLTRSAQADTAFLPFEVGPSAHKPRRQMLELCELDLQFAFMAVRALRKDIEDQAYPIDHAATQFLFEVAFLRGRQFVIEDDEPGPALCEQCRELFDFAGAGEKRGVRACALAAQNTGDTDARAQGELHEFVGRFRVIHVAEIETDEHRLGIAPGTFKHSVVKK